MPTNYVCVPPATITLYLRKLVIFHLQNKKKINTKQINNNNGHYRVGTAIIVTTTTSRYRIIIIMIIIL